ncbi:MAG: OmpA family protein [Bacteroidaceae bacterium]|nr:OmpA family protein [Bacteroidaceae bacterium]
MKKFTLLMVAMFSMAFSANAQYNVDGHKFWDNWSLGLEGGISTNAHDWNSPKGAIAGITVTKGITPVVSFEFGFNVGINNNYSWEMAHSANVIDNVSAIASTKINLMNWFGGYKGTPRLFEIQARGGFGYMREFYPDFAGNPTSSGNDLNRAIAKFGFDFDFNLGKAKAWTLSVRPAVVMKMARETSPAFMGCVYVDRCNAYGHNVIGQLTAGITYHFKTSNGTHNFAAVKPQVVTETVEKIVEKPVEKIVEKVVEKQVAAPASNNIYVVEFEQNKSNLSNTAKATLDQISNGTTVILDAYASPEGAKAYNQKLSQKRADAVKGYLENKGVKVADAKAHGAESKSSQRVVYVRIK